MLIVIRFSDKFSTNIFIYKKGTTNPNAKSSKYGNKFVALGFSSDQKKGNDPVVVCKFNEDGRAEVHN